MSLQDEDDLLPPPDAPSPPLLDVALGLAFAVGGAALIVASRAFPAMVPGTIVGPGLMPMLCGAIFLIFGGVLSLTAFQRYRRDGNVTEGEVERGSLPFAIVLMGGLVAVVWLADYLGFVVVSFLYSLAVTRAGGARWIYAAILALSVTMLTYVLFSNLMRVPLPRGSLLAGLPF